MSTYPATVQLITPPVVLAVSIDPHQLADQRRRTIAFDIKQGPTGFAGAMTAPWSNIAYVLEDRGRRK